MDSNNLEAIRGPGNQEFTIAWGKCCNCFDKVNRSVIPL